MNEPSGWLQSKTYCLPVTAERAPICWLLPACTARACAATEPANSHETSGLVEKISLPHPVSLPAGRVTGVLELEVVDDVVLDVLEEVLLEPSWVDDVELAPDDVLLVAALLGVPVSCLPLRNM